MPHRRLIVALLAGLSGAVAAQTPIQATGTLQSAEPVRLPEPVAATQSISAEGLSAPAPRGAVSSTAPDSGPQPWKDVMGWITLQQGQSPEEVKALLGSDYRESFNSKGMIWTFQDQKALLFGSVTFQDGKLESWTSPRF